MQGERITTESRIWERRRDRGASGFKAPKPPSQISNRIDARMADDTFEVQMAELEVELLTAKHALLQIQSAQNAQGSLGGASVYMDVPLWSYTSEQRSRRRRISKQQDEVVVKEQRGKKRYTVDVDMKDNPCGQNRSLWLTCLRGHSQDVNFSEDNYNAHKTSMLLNIKQRVDNTFEYEGGLGRITEEAFHSTLKGQLKLSGTNSRRHCKQARLIRNAFGRTTG
jgi:hypothetical protein